MNKAKFKSGDLVHWHNPKTKEQEEAQILKCDPYDPREPFYTIRLIHEFMRTHAFESSLEFIEDAGKEDG